MKKLLGILFVSMFAIGSAVYACESCGCKAKKGEAKTETCCPSQADCAAKKAECTKEGCTNKCCAVTKKGESTKEGSTNECSVVKKAE